MREKQWFSKELNLKEWHLKHSNAKSKRSFFEAKIAEHTNHNISSNVCYLQSQGQNLEKILKNFKKLELQTYVKLTLQHWREQRFYEVYQKSVENTYV